MVQDPPAKELDPYCKATGRQGCSAARDTPPPAGRDPAQEDGPFYKGMRKFFLEKTNYRQKKFLSNFKEVCFDNVL